MKFTLKKAETKYKFSIMKLLCETIYSTIHYLGKWDWSKVFRIPLQFPSRWHILNLFLPLMISG